MAVQGVEWQKLGAALIRRRIDLGYPKRSEFVKALGLSHDRTISDVENARRSNYEPATLATIESAYQLPPGTIDVILRGEAKMAEEGADPFGVRPVTRVHSITMAGPAIASGEALDATVRTSGQDALRSLLDLPDETLEGLDEVGKEEWRAALRAAAFKIAAEIRNR